jgi:hypothetical protein
MRVRVILCIGFLLFGFFCKAQFTENFSDGDYTNNPVWTPSSVTDWIVNASQQLQSNNTVASSTYYITTPSTLATMAQWEFYVNITFNPSSLNYIDVYLTSSSNNLSAITNTGYFVRIGNTNDQIAFYRKDASGIATLLIDGVHGILNTSNNVMKIKVIRNGSNQWTLLRDLSGSGSSYTSEGSIIDNTYSTSAFFGIFIKQSTASFFQKHFIDDITAQTYVPDVTPPKIMSAIGTTVNTVDVLFDEPVDVVSSQVAANYVANNGIGVATGAVRDASNNALVHLTFGNNFPNGNSTVTVNGVQDLSGNAIVNGTGIFSFYVSGQYDVVIDEIMADPTPQVGLPDAEWIELKNTTPYAINLAGWQIGKGASLSGPMPNYVLQPDSFVVVCTSSAVPLLSGYAHVFNVTSFPAIDNAGTLLFLLSSDGKVVHSVNYSDAWYQNPVKQGGGWTLEMIDTRNPCAGMSNWRASVDPLGGTPGRKNSIDAVNPDIISPSLLRAYANDSVTVTLVFNEPLDSLSASGLSNYAISDGITVSSVLVSSPVCDRVSLTFSPFITPNKIYTVSVANVTDCAGNGLGSASAQFGLSSSADSLDVVVNEILFNPASGGSDYVEVYNRSQKIIDLGQMFIANRNSSGVVSSIYPMANDHYLLFPGSYGLMTEDSSWVLSHYFTSNPKAFLQLSSMPSFNDDMGNVIILNQQGNIVDEVAYSDKWHFALISNTEGVSLERIDYNGPSAQQNFHSAATSVGYGTPGLKNSQYTPDSDVQAEINVTPDIFSPDNDGHDDFATINYSFPSPGYVTNITIYDASGRPVRYLQRNALNGIKGEYRWDGLGEKMQKLPIGIYIIVTEVFNTDGKRKVFKNTIVLARKM